MHIPDGVLDAPVLVVGAVLAAAGTAIGVRRIRPDDVPKVGLMTAAFFVASLIHVPVGIGSVHLILNGLAGLLLGWAVFPALLVGLFLQAVLFQFGGFTTLGVNTVVMATPAVVCAVLFRPLLRRGTVLTSIGGFATGAFSIFLSIVFYAIAFLASDTAYLNPVLTLCGAHIPIMIIEGVICMMTVGFFRQIRPHVLFGVEHRGRVDED